MNKRQQTAIEVLKAGGYIRKQLETGFRGREQFKYRLRRKDGSLVTGIGDKTLIDLVYKYSHFLQKRPVPRSSVWPEEWELRS